MRIIFAAIAIFIVASFIVGKITTGKNATLRKSFSKGAYYVGITVLAFAVIAGIIAIIYNIGNADGRDDSGPLAGMDKSRKAEFLDSLFTATPNPSSGELQTIVIDYDFQNSVLPCYESVHVFDVASLREIVSLQRTDDNLAGRIFEINAQGEFRTNKPIVGFHVKADMDIQYRFADGSRERAPGWHLSKILVSECEVLSSLPNNKVTGRDSLYPDLKRRVD